jgi:hypothetical protein
MLLSVFARLNERGWRAAHGCNDAFSMRDEIADITSTDYFIGCRWNVEVGFGIGGCLRITHTDWTLFIIAQRSMHFLAGTIVTKESVDRTETYINNICMSQLDIKRRAEIEEIYQDDKIFSLSNIHRV